MSKFVIHLKNVVFKILTLKIVALVALIAVAQILFYCLRIFGG